jgi:hypothetical protein
MSDKNYKHIFIWSSGLHIETNLKKPIEDFRTSTRSSRWFI